MTHLLLSQPLSISRNNKKKKNNRSCKFTESLNKSRLDFRRSLVSGLPSFPEQRLVIEPRISLPLLLTFNRKLNYPYIVKFYGSSLLKKGDQTRAVLVMELCKENLMRHIFQNPKNIPARIPSSTPPTDRTTIGWAKDIANGLEYIHKQGYVHRDLKLENILVRKQAVSVLLGLINCRWLYLGCGPLVVVLDS